MFKILKYFYTDDGDKRVLDLNVLASFEYLCDGSTASINIFTITVRG